MFSTVAQSILQFNQERCQDDNLFNQIDVERPRQMGYTRRGLYRNGLTFAWILAAAATSRRRGGLLRLNILSALQVIESIFGRGAQPMRLWSFIHETL